MKLFVISFFFGYKSVKSRLECSTNSIRKIYAYQFVSTVLSLTAHHNLPPHTSMRCAESMCSFFMSFYFHKVIFALNSFAIFIVSLVSFQLSEEDFDQLLLKIVLVFDLLISFEMSQKLQLEM